MYRASLEGHRKSSTDNKCCNTLMLFIATLCNKARELRDGGGHKMSHFILIWCTRVQHSIETNMVTIHHNGWAEAETLMGGYNISGLTCAPRQTTQWVSELPRSTAEGNSSIWKSTKGLREVKWRGGRRKRGRCHGRNCTQIDECFG